MEPRHELYDGTQRFFAMHFNGTCHAIFATAHAAHSWQIGNQREVRRGHDYFHLENAKGERITLDVNQHGHAYAILDALSQRERT